MSSPRRPAEMRAAPRVPKTAARAKVSPPPREQKASRTVVRGRGRFRRAAFVDLGSSTSSGAYLTLSARSAATTFYVNNRPVGTGLVVRHKVDEGVHRIEAVGPGGARVSKWLAVTAGDDRQLSFIR